MLHRQIARGGMATIHIARLMGDEGFSRIVAAKRLLPEFAEDTEFVAMFMDEARIASKVHHPNVVPVLDLVTTTDEVMLVQEYVHGVPLHVLLRTAHEAGKKIPVKIAVSIAAQVLAGLHAAHTTLDEMGAPLNIVHRDVSPQNVMVAVDGSARLLDFGVAKATMGAHITREGTFKGKLAYSAPEQVRGKPCQQSDIYALSVVLWELLVGHRMHGSSQGEAELVATIMNGNIPPVTEALSNEADWGAIDSDEWKMLSAIETIVAKGLDVDLAKRYDTAADMETDLRKAVTVASSNEVSAWVKSLGKDFIESRDKVIAAEEQSWRRTASTTGVRRTPLPGSLPRPSTISEVSQPQLPLAPKEVRRTRMIIGVLGALVILLAVGVVVAMQTGDSNKHEAQAAPAPTQPTAVETEKQAPPPAAMPTEKQEPKHETATAPPQPTQPTETAATEAATTETTASTETTETATTEKPTTTTTRKWGRNRVVKKAEPEKKDPPPVVTPAVTTEKPANDCSPPYYYEGQKKVFKPNCL
ncbi:MAG TPA: protein kinase [Kofleriaceae bacterium]|nr:protein kinase [Kofleriaceae bacterium]